MKTKTNVSLINVLFRLTGNAKACVLTEPIIGIPYNLYIPFFTLYMYSLGVKDVQIGLLLTIGLFVQMFTALLGGVLTDKFGRRKTTALVDIFAWSVPLFIWAFARDFRWFLIAGLINSLWLIPINSWQCLMVEDSEPEHLVPIYNWIYIAGLVAVFFAPISGLLIERHSLVPVMRVLFIISGIAMTLKILLLYRYSKETKQGLIKMKETAGVPLLKMIGEYGGVFRQMLKTPATLRVLALISLANVHVIISSNFFSLYVTQNLHIPEQYLAWFPMLRAAIMLISFFTAQEWLSRFPIYIVLLVGVLFYAAGHGVLLAAPPNALPPLMLHIGIDACAGALFLPRRDALMMENVDPKERARILSLLLVIMLGVSSPFGYITGLLSHMNRRLPFFFNLVLFALMAAVMLMERRSKLPRFSANRE